MKKSANRNASMMAFVKFVSFIMPLAIYLLSIIWIFPAPNSGFVALGVLGCMIIGLGLVNITGLIDKMYLGHIVTAVLISCGSIFVIVSSIMIYSSAIYSKLNEIQVSFYFMVWSLLAVSGIYYPLFRHAIFLDLRNNGASKSNIKKRMEGTPNYWFYQSLKDQFSYKWVFWVNKLFIMLFPCVCMFQLLLGWMSICFFVVLVALTALLLMNVTMGFLIFATRNHPTADRTRSSSLAGISMSLFPIVAILALIIYYIKYFRQ